MKKGLSEPGGYLGRSQRVIHESTTHGGFQEKRWPPSPLNLYTSEVLAQRRAPPQDLRKRTCPRLTTQVPQTPANANNSQNMVKRAHATALDQLLPETTNPPETDNPLGGQETRAFVKARQRRFSGAGATACVRAELPSFESFPRRGSWAWAEECWASRSSRWSQRASAVTQRACFVCRHAARNDMPP